MINYPLSIISNTYCALNLVLSLEPSWSIATMTTFSHKFITQQNYSFSSSTIVLVKAAGIKSVLIKTNKVDYSSKECLFS